MSFLDGSVPARIDAGRFTEDTRQASALFHTPDGTTYASVPAGEGGERHLEHLAIKGAAFRDWLTYRWWRSFHAAPTNRALDDVVRDLHVFARFEGPEEDVYLRL